MGILTPTLLPAAARLAAMPAGARLALYARVPGVSEFEFQIQIQGTRDSNRSVYSCMKGPFHCLR